jgi:hypothetical protein
MKGWIPASAGMTDEEMNSRLRGKDEISPEGPRTYHFRTAPPRSAPQYTPRIEKTCSGVLKESTQGVSLPADPICSSSLWSRRISLISSSVFISFAVFLFFRPHDWFKLLNQRSKFFVNNMPYNIFAYPKIFMNNAIS